MNDEEIIWQRWYPLTYPGYYKKDLTESPSLHYEHCRLDVRHLAGACVGVQAASETADAVSTITDEKGNVLAQWEFVPEILEIPASACYLYLNNQYDINSDFYLLLPPEKTEKPEGFLFCEDFTAPSALDGNDFLGELQITDQGLVIPHGIENAMVIHKSTALDDWCLTAEITAPDGDEAICLGTRITQDRPCRHATLCCVDMAARELRLYRGSNGQAMPEEILQHVSLTDLPKKGEFTLRLERINLAIHASVIDPATGKTVSLTQALMEEEAPPASIAGACRAGKMFDSPQVFALSGEPILRRIYGVAKMFPKVIFFGDSITQGAHNMPENGWAQMCAAQLGNSICCGRGSGDIWSCLNQVRTMLPTLRPKAMVVTIGANNNENTASTETVRYLYEKFIAMAEYCGVRLILNCIPVCPRPHIAGTNAVLRTMDIPKCRFDLALTENNEPDAPQVFDYYVSDKTHLNGEGNKILYRYFVEAFPWLRDL